MVNLFKVIIVIAGLTGTFLIAQKTTAEVLQSREGVLARVPSEGANPAGIVVRITAPAICRYPEGAPVVVHVAPNFAVDDSPLKLTEYGFVEVRFLWPGGSSKPQPDGVTWASGGAAPAGIFLDEAAVRATAAVLAFASGRTRTLDGKRLQDYLPATPALTGNVGVIGWSVGGNLAAAAMDLGGSEFRKLAWYVSFESPFGDGMLDGEFGTHSNPNRFYDSQRGSLDLSALKYGKDLPITSLFGGIHKGAETFHGSLYLDGNGSGTFDKDSDFLFTGMFRRTPAPNVFYSPPLTRAAKKQSVFGAQWPAHIANVQQSEEFYKLQDGVSHIRQIRKNIPDLAVIVQASVQDHASTAADHRHIFTQYDSFLSSGVRWIRLNPDSHYVEWTMGRQQPGAIQNQAGRKFERSAILPGLEPSPADSGPTPTEALAAAACELADRIQTKNWKPVLPRVLFPYAPRGASTLKQ